MKFLRGQPLDEEERHDAEAHAYVVEHILEPFMQEANQTLEALSALDDADTQKQRNVLVKRWTQIKDLIQQGIKNGPS